MDSNNLPVLYTEVASKIATIRQQAVIADADVAELYGVETRRINEAVRNNPDKFPIDYMFPLTDSELRDLRSKFRPQRCQRRAVLLPKCLLKRVFICWRPF